MDKQSPEVVAAVSAFAGAAALKIIGHFFGWKKRELDEATAIRKELRAEVQRLAARVDEMHNEIDSWRTKFYKLTEENLALRAECHALRSEIQKIQLKEKVLPPSGASK
jgi:peptidoglycan hydrolase CwlO-like protein